MKKNHLVKTVALIIIIAMLATTVMALIPAISATEEELTEGQYIYTVSDGKATIINTESTLKGSIILPESLGGYPVTAIGRFAFSRTQITSITIPKTIVSIAECAFEWCSNLETVTFSEYAELESIGDSAFYDCKKLSGIDLPNSLHTVDANAFSGCYSIITEENDLQYVDNWVVNSNKEITEIIWSEGTEGIGAGAFKGCTKITAVEIPNGVRGIGINAFGGAQNLKSVTIPASVIKIGIIPFNSCDELEAITVNDNPKYHSSDNCIIETASKTLVTGCNVSEIPADGSVETLAYGAFANFSRLESISIPASVKYIDGYAFSYCISLKNILFAENSRLEATGEAAFTDCTLLDNVKLPDSLKIIGDRTFQLCTSLTDIEIPDSVEYIGLHSFSHCKSLEEVTIPNPQTELHAFVFSGELSSALVIKCHENSRAHIHSKNNSLAFELVHFNGENEWCYICYPDGIIESGSESNTGTETESESDISKNTENGSEYVGTPNVTTPPLLGCFSSVSGGAAVLAAIASLASLTVFRKKED